MPGVNARQPLKFGCCGRVQGLTDRVSEMITPVFSMASARSPQPEQGLHSQVGRRDDQR